MAGNTGWVLTDDALDRTSDGGQAWTVITPPGVRPSGIRGVFFLDNRHGWVVSGQARHPEQLQISTTADGGAAWSTIDLGGPAPDFADSTGLPVYIDFVDTQHGWVMVLAAASDAGYLFRTTDGGATWRQLPRPIGGAVEFISPATGWLTSAGQPGTRFSESFYVTHDGGQTWHAETVTPPAGFRRDQATYSIPAFTTPAPVLLAAFNTGTRSTAGFYQTRDGGATWHLAATVPAGKPAGDVSPSSAIIGATHWVAVSIYGTSVTNVTRVGAAKATVSPVGLPPGGIGDASFTNTRSGWVVTDTFHCVGFKCDQQDTETLALYATSDGGAHWSVEVAGKRRG